VGRRGREGLHTRLTGDALLERDAHNLVVPLLRDGGRSAGSGLTRSVHLGRQVS
jgi:hypothetical protein